MQRAGGEPQQAEESAGVEAWSQENAWHFCRTEGLAGLQCVGGVDWMTVER